MAIDTQRNTVEELAEDFLARLRRGEHPALSEYTSRNPQLADEIREIFPALAVMEQARPRQGVSGLGARITCDGRPLERLGDYRIVREVGRGGMGVVYEAEQEALGRHVALKVLPFTTAIEPRHLLRFRREARSAARLHHTNIVPVYDIGERDGVHYYAMQFIQGQALDEVMVELRRLRGRATAQSASHRLSGAVESASEHAEDLAERMLTGEFDRAALEAQPPAECAEDLAAPESAAASLPADHTWPQPGFQDARPRSAAQAPDASGAISALTDPSDSAQSGCQYYRSVARIGLQVAEALAYAHGQRVLHRDVKPANLLFDACGTVWVTDFGLAKEEGDDFTATGDVVGTLRYMAPERFHGVSDPRSDVYGLGLTLYELITLRPAYSEDDRARLAQKIGHTDPPAPHKFDAHVPRDLETIILKAIAREPVQRYAASEMAEDLRRFLSDRPIRARRVGMVEQAWRWCRRNRLVAALSAVVFMLALALVIGGSVAILTHEERNRALAAEERALAAERETTIRAHLVQAIAQRRGGLPGRRGRALDEIRRAVQLGPSEELRLELRNEAIAAMALVDLQAVAGPNVAGTRGLVFDRSYARYAFVDERANIHVRHVGESLDRSVLSGLGPAGGLLSFSPSGRYLAAHPGSGGTTQIWEVESGRQVFSQPLQGYSHPSFSPDESCVAIGLLAGSVGVYELPGGRELRRLATGSVPSSVAFHPDGQRVAVAVSRSRTVKIWDVERDSVVAELSHEGPVHFVTWDADGRRLALGCQSPNRFEVWDVATVQRIAVLDCASYADRAEFLPAGNLIATWSWDGITRVWDAATARQLVAWPSGTTGSSSRDGRVLGSVLADGSTPQSQSSSAANTEIRAPEPRVQLVELSTGTEYRTLSSRPAAGEDGYNDGAVSPDGRLLAVAMLDGVRIWEVACGRERAHLPTETTQTAFFSPDGRELITSGVDGLVRWPVQRDLDLHAIRVGPPRVVPLPISAVQARLTPDGHTAGVSADPSNKGLIVDLTTETATATIEPHANMTRLVVSGDGQWAASFGCHSQFVKVWNVRTGELAKEFEGASAYASFSPDDKQLIISRHSDFSFYEVGSWRLTRKLPREFCPYPGYVAYSPDGSIMALELSDAVISLVDSVTGRTLAKLEDPHHDRPRWTGFTPDGRRLVVVAHYAKTIHVLELGRIRQQLEATGLDWDPSPVASHDEAIDGEPLTITVDLGEIGPRAATARNARQARTHHDLAQAHFDSKRWPESISAYKRAITLDPDEPLYRNNFAWLLATCPDPLYRDELAALEHAQKAVELEPNNANAWNTLGVAHYRSRKWQAAIDDLVKAEELNPDTYLGHNAIFLAMAHWQLGDQATARDWFEKAVAWLEQHQNSQYDEELRRFRAEAEELLGNNGHAADRTDRHATPPDCAN